MKKKISVRKLKLGEIDELSMVIFICRTKLEPQLKNYVNDIGGIVLSSIRGKGLSSSAVAAVFGAYSEMNVVFVMCQKEIAQMVVQDTSERFQFNKAGNGRGFVVDIDGYMGAKAPFID